MRDDFITLSMSFVGGSTIEQHHAFQMLLAIKQHHKAAQQEEFKLGIQSLLLSARSGAPNDRLLALATLGRVASAVKRLRSFIHDEISNALVTPLPKLQFLRDPDDRVYVAEALRLTEASWVADYAGQAAIHEESAEEARTALIDAAFSTSGSVSLGFSTLTRSIKQWRPDTGAPQNSVARRIRRVLEAASKAIASNTNYEAGDRPGYELALLVQGAFTVVGMPTDLEIASETAEAVAGAIHELVRLSFSLATQSETYEALTFTNSWFTERRWDEFASRSSIMALVARDIREALLILVRQGIADNNLITQLQVATGSRQRAQLALLPLSRLPGIRDDLRIWIVDGRKSLVNKSKSSESETATHQQDRLLADVLVDGQRFRTADAALRKDIFPELGALEPRAVRQIERALNFGLAVCDGLDQIGRRRRLQLRGAPGDIEDYSPIEHELTDGSTGARHVRIVRPLVEASREDGSIFVIQKGIVERLGTGE